jgi:hypothetical protein
VTLKMGKKRILELTQKGECSAQRHSSVSIKFGVGYNGWRFFLHSGSGSGGYVSVAFNSAPRPPSVGHRHLQGLHIQIQACDGLQEGPFLKEHLGFEVILM